MKILYSEIVIRNGKKDNKETKLAPAPRRTKKDGNAQQINVEVEANKESQFVTLFSCSLSSISVFNCSFKTMIRQQ